MDGLPEAIEIPSRRFVLGVQWHPEADQTSQVVRAMVAEAERAARNEVVATRAMPGRVATDASV
jgi:putative glutamine amidotransferase